MFKKIILFSFCVSLFGANYTLDELKQKPKSIAKDYYIYKNISVKAPTKTEADELKGQIYRYAGKIQKIIERISPTPPRKDYLNLIVKKDPTCFGYKGNTLLKYSQNCQKLVINNDFITIKTMDSTTRTALAKKFAKDKDIVDTLNALNQKKPMSYLANKNAQVFLRFYANGYKQFDDFYGTKKFVNDLKSSKVYDAFMKDVIINKKYPKLRSTFIYTSLDNLDANTSFYMGLNALSFDKPKNALGYFELAYNGYNMNEFKDNALFWMYYLTTDKQKKQELLKKLANSISINMYSVYAKEKLNMPLPSYENGVTNANPTKQSVDGFDVKDPFMWQDLLKKISKAKKDTTALKALANEYFTKDTLPHFAYIDAILSGYKNHYFLMPYMEHLKGSNHRKALILAIARQESRFVPAAISTSYALGMMQFMPFLAEHVGKDILKLENFDADVMFDPKTAYEFANIHLDYLEKYLHSPVFIAYAYNGGLGFTQRMLKRDDMFRKGKYEPFLSMEFVPYAESRLYAKKVLSNYIIYLNLLGEKTEIWKVFADLDSQTDQTLVKSQS